jgi:hypothetical protein
MGIIAGCAGGLSSQRPGTRNLLSLGWSVLVRHLGRQGNSLSRSMCVLPTISFLLFFPGALRRSEAQPSACTRLETGVTKRQKTRLKGAKLGVCCTIVILEGRLSFETIVATTEHSSEGLPPSPGGNTRHRCHNNRLVQKPR